MPKPESVAHRAGNSRTGLQRAIAAGVDWIEADIWLHYGRLEARHEHAIWRLPVRYDQWKLGIAVRRPLRLGEICRLTAGGPRVLVDMKGTDASLPRAVVKTLQAESAVGRAAICGQVWSLLDVATSIEPALQAFYSIETEQQLAALRARPAELPKISAVSCEESLLTPAAIAGLREGELAIMAWTVNDRSRALELVGQGVAGVISDSYEVLAAIKSMRGLPAPGSTGSP